MHLDLNSTELTRHDTDICIVGSGVAGISAARRLLALGRTVTILESGGEDYEPAIADINAGEVVGQPYYDLEDSRLRFFGGTTAIWGGRIAAMDPIDFERRSWVPHSGWPLSFADLQSYYSEAWKVFDVAPDRVPDDGLSQAGIDVPDFNDQRIAIKLWSFDNRFNRFTFGASQDLLHHSRATVITHATVTDIETGPEARAVASLVARSLSGCRIRIHARTFILAAGGLDNPRLLLAARSAMPMGLGNGHDLVGRYFMEHPHARGGSVLTGKSWALLNTFDRRHLIGRQIIAPLIAASEQEQARAQMLNSSLTIVARQPADAAQCWSMRAYNRIKHDVAPTRAARALWMNTKRTAHYLQRKFDPLRPWLLHQAGRLELALLVRAEQAPNPMSRVMLSEQKDAFGVPRVKLDWRLSDLDIHSVDRLVDTLGFEFSRLGLGEVVKAEWLSAPARQWRSDPLISAHPIGGYHHMGTTRMANNPRQGVTDPFGRVHGIDNLYIVGSSLFPTSGWANPTLTIVALALRTADHISRRPATPVERRNSRQSERVAHAVA